MFLRVEVQDFRSILQSWRQPGVSVVTRNGLHLSVDAQAPSNYRRKLQTSSRMHDRIMVDGGGEEEEEEKERGRESVDEPDGALLPR